MKIIMPMAGLGSRFTKVGINTPKPLINILGKPMAKWAAESIPFVSPEDFIFIIQKEHVEQFNLDQEIKKIFSDKCKVIIIDYVTEGAACTVLLAKEYINNNEPIIITDCDHFFVNNEYEQILKNAKTEDVKGIIPVFKAEGTKWSFSKFEEDHIITLVAEKNPISNYANIGAYCFLEGKDFVWAAEKLIKENKRINNEFYIAPTYNELINRGDKIKATICLEVYGLGTPEDVAYFEANYPKQLKNQRA